MPKKTPTKLTHEIAQYLAGSSVVKPHVRTHPACVKCSQFHTAQEHDGHAKHKPKPKKSARPASKKRSVASRTTSRPSTQDPLVIVRKAVRSAPKSDRFGDGNVFIYAVWRRIKNKIHMSLKDFKRWLIAQNRLSNLLIIRADLVDMMDPRLVQESEIQDLGATFHFIVDHDARRAY